MEEAWPYQNLVCTPWRTYVYLKIAELPLPVRDFPLDVQSGIPLQACEQQQIPCKLLFVTEPRRLHTHRDGTASLPAGCRSA